MFTDPQPTPYDLRFRFLGMPIRVHPFFWLMTLFLFPNSEGMPNPVPFLLLWVASVFISILLHELGHAVVQKYLYGAAPRIVLYAFGGLACSDLWGYRRRPGTWGSILISAAGPLSGFLLVALLLGIAFAVGWTVLWGDITFFRILVVPIPSIISPLGDYANVFIAFLVLISIYWGVFNLLPVYPLDGGNIARELCLLAAPRRGIIISLRISLFTAAVIAALLFADWLSSETKRFPFGAILMAFLAFQSWQAIQYHERGYR